MMMVVGRIMSRYGGVDGSDDGGDDGGGDHVLGWQ